MIIARVEDRNIFQTIHSHIAFAISVEGGGLNLCGFGGQLASQGHWPNLILIRNQPPGSVISRKVSNRTYHALVVYRFKPNGWINTPQYLREALNLMKVPDDVIVAISQIGAADSAGKTSGVNQKAIEAAMEASKRRLVVYMRPRILD